MRSVGRAPSHPRTICILHNLRRTTCIRQNLQPSCPGSSGFVAPWHLAPVFVVQVYPATSPISSNATANPRPFPVAAPSQQQPLPSKPLHSPQLEKPPARPGHPYACRCSHCHHHSPPHPPHLHQLHHEPTHYHHPPVPLPPHHHPPAPPPAASPSSSAAPGPIQ